MVWHLTLLFYLLKKPTWSRWMCPPKPPPPASSCRLADWVEKAPPGFGERRGTLEGWEKSGRRISFRRFVPKKNWRLCIWCFSEQWQKILVICCKYLGGKKTTQSINQPGFNGKEGVLRFRSQERGSNPKVLGHIWIPKAPTWKT